MSLILHSGRKFQISLASIQLDKNRIRAFVYSFPKCNKAPNEVEALRSMLLIFSLSDLDFLRFNRVTEIFRIETVLPAVGRLRLGIHKKRDLRPIRLRQI
jgi:hypothetical protein